jgi:hypothetical protein
MGSQSYYQGELESFTNNQLNLSKDRFAHSQQVDKRFTNKTLDGRRFQSQHMDKRFDTSKSLDKRFIMSPREMP